MVDEAGDDASRLEADRRLHLASYAAAPLPRVLTMIEGFWNQTQQYRRAYLFTIRADLEIVSIEHKLMLEALQRRDPEDAAHLQRIHIRRTRMALAPHAELFD